MPPRQKPENMRNKLFNGMDVSDQPKNKDTQNIKVKPMGYRIDGMLVTPNLVVICTKCGFRVVSIHWVVSCVEFKDVRCVVKCVGIVGFDDE
jgi:hypothetical protein